MNPYIVTVKTEARYKVNADNSTAAKLGTAGLTPFFDRDDTSASPDNSAATEAAATAAATAKAAKAAATKSAAPAPPVAGPATAGK
jgi:hypothetical protein